MPITPQKSKLEVIDDLTEVAENEEKEDEKLTYIENLRMIKR